MGPVKNYIVYDNIDRLSTVSIFYNCITRKQVVFEEQIVVAVMFLTFTDPKIVVKSLFPILYPLSVMEV